MSVSTLTSTAQDYLKLIWSATEWSESPITVKELAERLGVRPASVSDAIRRLGEQGLLRHEPYSPIELTDEGRAHAVAMVRRHRLIETFLVEVLGYGWDEVHDEAERLEHAVSDELVDRIDARLGHPTRDPHGDPIPSPEGTPHRPDAVLLREAPTGAPLVVARISDADPGILRYLAEHGVALDTRLTVERDRGYAGIVTVRLGGDRVLDLGSVAAGAVWVASA